MDSLLRSGSMSQPKITAKRYKVLVKTARKRGGDENQAHWNSRLKAVMAAPAKAAAKRPRKRPVP